MFLCSKKYHIEEEGISTRGEKLQHDIVSTGMDGPGDINWKMHEAEQMNNPLVWKAGIDRE